MKVHGAKKGWEDEAMRGKTETETESSGSGHEEAVNDC